MENEDNPPVQKNLLAEAVRELSLRNFVPTGRVWRDKIGDFAVGMMDDSGFPCAVVAKGSAVWTNPGSKELEVSFQVQLVEGWEAPVIMALKESPSASWLFYIADPVQIRLRPHWKNKRYVPMVNFAFAQMMEYNEHEGLQEIWEKLKTKRKETIGFYGSGM